MSKIAFIDVDGCLNPPSGEDFPSGLVGEITTDQKEVFARLLHALEGSSLEAVVMNTGRGIEDALYIARSLPTPKLRYLLLEHSLYGYDLERDCEIDLGQLAEALGLLEIASRYRQIETIERVVSWYTHEGQAILRDKIARDCPALPKRGNLSMAIPDGYDAEGLIEELKDLVKECLGSETADKLTYCHSNLFVDCIGSVHKSDGVVILMQHLGYKPKDALIVGDGKNDLDVFGKFENLLCPANAHPEIIEMTRERGGVVSEHPFAECLIRHLEVCAAV